MITQLNLVDFDSDTNENETGDRRSLTTYLIDPPVVVSDSAGFDEMLHAIASAPIVGVDSETTGLDPHTNSMRLLQIAVSDRLAYVVDCFANVRCRLPELTKAFAGKRKVFHNAAFDLKFLRSVGVDVGLPLFDTFLAAKVYVNGTRAACSLRDCVDRYLNVALDKTEQKSDFSGKLTQEQIHYAAVDACILIPLRKALLERFKDYDRRVAERGERFGMLNTLNIEFGAVLAVSEMEYQGLRFDWDSFDAMRSDAVKDYDAKLAKLYEALDEAGADLQRDLFGTPSVNLNSPEQVQRLLTSLGYDIESVNEKYLRIGHGDDPLILAYLTWKNAATRIKDLDKYPPHLNEKTGRIHSSFKQLGAESGRFSSTSPNVQNLPRGGFRDLVIPDEGNVFVCCDYSQIEVRIAAHLSGDQTMIDAYKRGEDLHRLTASIANQCKLDEVTKAQRQAAKAINFGLLYGMGARSLKDYAKTNYGVEMTLDDAYEFSKRYFEGYRGVYLWHRAIESAIGAGLSSIKTEAGRRRILKPQDKKLQSCANTPDQGLGADILKTALKRVYDAIRTAGYEGKAHIVNCVHDEILIECEAAIADDIEALLKREMIAAAEIYITDIPIEAEGGIGNTWGSAK
ncbi:DNA polymerase [Roseofilum capinflatum]|uniref:DNA polymerase I n=1 Tax=Roseofilum capinflatum BLCC-M114 TaxID=3022440 RepID=A0ABT7B6B0_9CYAN|nr:DNA polymerase [Roseofilum capinflatum]MDJ1174706.1 DNA polymerase [Roseofilum capinflatum BLCC-M114]